MKTLGVFLYDWGMENTYIVYIDESNISNNMGYSVYVSVFVLYLEKDDINHRLMTIEKELNITHVHWVDMPWRLRTNFAKKIKNLKFYCNVSLYKNPINPESILEDFISNILTVDNLILKFVVDGKKSPANISKLRKRLKRRGVIIYRLLFADDKSEPSLRLADFMAGLVRSHIHNRNKENDYMYNMLKHKIKIPD